MFGSIAMIYVNWLQLQYYIHHLNGPLWNLMIWKFCSWIQPIQLTLLSEGECITAFTLFNRLTKFWKHVQQNVSNILFCLPSKIVPTYFYSSIWNCAMNEKYDCGNILTSGSRVSWIGWIVFLWCMCLYSSNGSQCQDESYCSWSSFCDCK